MARGVRRTIEEQLDALNVQIARAERQLKALYDQKEELEKKQREEQAMYIYRLMSDNDVTMEELMEMIQNKKSQEVA